MILADSLIFPTFSEVILRLYEQGPRFLFHLRITLLEMSLSMGAAICLGFPIAYLMARFRPFRLTFQPLFILFKCLPMFALAPVMLLLFGFSIVSIVIPTTLMILFPLTINIYRGLMATPESYLNFFKVHGASQGQIFFKLKLRFALPYIFSGLRIGSAIAAMASIAGEWAGAQNGLGIFMHELRYQFDIEGVFATLLCLVFLSLTFYSSFILLEKWVIGKRWKYEV